MGLLGELYPDQGAGWGVSTSRIAAPVLSVVIPTIGVRPEILRAVASIQAQTTVPCLALVVVNGNRYDPRLVARLEANPIVRVLHTPVPGVSHARLLAVRHIETPFFGLLDDDDELLPDCLAPVMAAFEAGADVVATNGLLEIGGNLSVKHANLSGYGDDHALALLYENWVSSGGTFCRTAGVPAELFEELPNYMELTQLGMRMTQRCRISRIDCKTFIYHVGAAEQATKSPAYLRAEPRVMKNIASEVARRDIRAKLRRKRSAALHDCAEFELAQQNIGKAWRDHIASMLGGGGLRYVSYTRHLLRGTVAAALRALRPAPVPEHAAGPVAGGPDV